MRRRLLRFSGILACLCILGMILRPASGLGQQARANGLPNSTSFGYGARFNPQGPQADWALNTAAAMQFDWLAIDLPWQQVQPIRDQVLQAEQLDKVMLATLTQPSSVLISITAPPPWAMQANGPNPELVSALVRELLLRYPGRALAFELFPAANTLSGWGAVPDPAAYAALLRTVRTSLSDITSDLNLVAAGLSTTTPATIAGDMNDLEYLQGLYIAGAQELMPIVSIRLPAVQEDLLAAPAPGQPVVLRHYEQVRQVMLDAGHTSGLIWITGFSWPADDSSRQEHRLQQARWLEQAYTMLKAQLYIGAAIYSCLNPPADSVQVGFTGTTTGCLLETRLAEPSLHPAASILAGSIYQAHTGQAPPVQIFLEKQAPNTKLKYGKS